MALDALEELFWFLALDWCWWKLWIEVFFPTMEGFVSSVLKNPPIVPYLWYQDQLHIQAIGYKVQGYYFAKQDVMQFFQAFSTLKESPNLDMVTLFWMLTFTCFRSISFTIREKSFLQAIWKGVFPSYYQGWLFFLYTLIFYGLFGVRISIIVKKNSNKLFFSNLSCIM